MQADRAEKTGMEEKFVKPQASAKPRRALPFTRFASFPPLSCDPLMFSRFFIDRPIFASVLSIVIALGGGLALLNLPLAQYPPVAPPQVQVNCSYPGASAQVVAETVAAPIEQHGQRRREHAVHVVAVRQRRHLQADRHIQAGDESEPGPGAGAEPREPRLADASRRAQAAGVTTRKLAPDILMSVNINSPRRPLRPALPEQLRPDAGQRRVAPPGGNRRHFPQRPARLQHEDLARPRQAGRPQPHAPTTWSLAIREQNAQVACGQIGQQPAPPGQATQITSDHPRPPEGAGAVRRTSFFAPRPRGGSLRIRDVGRVELGA